MDNKFIKNCIEKVTDEYLDNYKTDNRNLFISIYNKIQKTKMHIWSQLLAFTGWKYIPYTKIKYFESFATMDQQQQIESIIIITLSFFLVFYIESIFFPDFRIKWKFIYENRMYCLFWNIGIILFVIMYFNIIGNRL